MTISITKVGIMPPSIMSFSKISRVVIFRIFDNRVMSNDTQHRWFNCDTLHNVMLCPVFIVMLIVFIQCHYAGCAYDECH